MSNAEFAARGVEAAKAFMERRDYEIEAVDWKCDAGQIKRNVIEWSASQ